jgi:hypothetical protein
VEKYQRIGEKKTSKRRFGDYHKEKKRRKESNEGMRESKAIHSSKANPLILPQQVA